MYNEKAKGVTALEEKIRQLEKELSLLKPLIISGVLLALFLLLAMGVLFGEAARGTQAAEALQQADGGGVPTFALNRRHTVVIDAGHGGVDTGAVGIGGAVETDITPQLAERVLALLAQHPEDFLAVPAHEFDTYETAMGRANTAAGLQADLLVSLHLNADTSPYTRGYQVFPAPPGRLHHDESVRFATLLTQQVQGTGVPVLGGTGIYYAYYPKIPNGYGKYIVEAAQVDENDPPAHESFGVVEYAGCPAVLAELWHITSTQDMALFHHEAGYDTVARCVYHAICEFFAVAPL